MKRHAGGTRSTTNHEKKRAARVKARERKIRRAHNILVNNVSLKERARRRGESTTKETERLSFLDTLRRGFGGNHDYGKS